MNVKAKIILLLFGLLLSNSNLFAQVYVDNKTQHRFAQTYVGFNTQIIPSQGQLFWNGQVRPFPTLAVPRLTIGGLHFWGKVDFNLNIPLARIGDQRLNDDAEMDFNTGGDLSARFYPWQMRYNRIRPYVGVGFNDLILTLKSESQGFRGELFVTTSLIGGFSYATKKGVQFNAEMMWLPNNDREYYSSRTDKHTYSLPGAYLSFGVVKYFEGSLSEEKRKLSGETLRLESQLRKENKLNSFSVAIAPSGAYFLKYPKFKDPIAESLPRHKAVFNFDYGLGYLFHDAGLHVGLSYRDYTSDSESYEVESLLRRNSIALEVLKFFWDYNGFVPFIGPSISYERWGAARFIDDVQQGETHRTQMVSPGIVFGWDIVPSSLETWVLRTNLRYYPFQSVTNSEGFKSRVDQFEFNFIQLVIYPNRIRNIKR